MNAFHALRRSRLSPLSACLAAAFATASPHETLAANLPVTSCLDDGSPAIDTGNDVAALATDQRGGGYVRVSGAAADIGAYELQPLPDVIFGNGFDP